MSAPVSDVEICTLAADLIKATEVNSLDDPKETVEEYSARWWDISRRQALTLYKPNFARKRANISLNSTAPAFGYDDQYQLPNDFVALRFIQDSDIPLSHWKSDIEGDQLLINNGGDASLPIGYVWDETAVANWDDMFKKGCAIELAYNICYGLTGQKTLVAAINTRRRQFGAEVRAMNGQQNPPTYNVYSYAKGARNRYAGGNGRYYGSRARV